MRFHKFKKYISGFLLFTISLFIVPKEYFHDLAGHEDTRDIPGKDITFTNIHHHCEILNYNTPHYIFQYKVVLLPFTFFQQTINTFASPPYFISFFHHFDTRAPPCSLFV